jgi:hypothetical protein
MGFKTVDLVPISTLGPTVLTPPAKDVYEKVFQVSRTDTVTSLKAQLPADASVAGIVLFGNANSDSATSAAVTITVANNSGTLSTGTVDVKANGNTTAYVQMSNLPNLEVFPLLGDIRISAVYAEVGASTVGGPWKIIVRYVR